MKTKIYTKKGDQGKGFLIGIKKIWKDDLRVEAIGQIDELNSWLGLLITKKSNLKIKQQLVDIQFNLMLISASIAQNNKIIKKLNNSISQLENCIDQMENKIPVLQQFILPGGGEIGSQIHIVRSICRRVERRLITLSRKEELPSEILIYINRLSDYFFILARYLNNQSEKREIIWEK